jgi:hypothetical protein
MVQFLAGARIFLFSAASRLLLVSVRVLRVLSPLVKLPRDEADHSPSGAEAKNV